MTARPLVSVYNAESGLATESSLPLPKVFETPIRDDVVRKVFDLMAKNHRQAYGVWRLAGHETAAESWGTGRAVSRIPRVPGGGTHRAGQGAFGNMCRGGHMFAPNKTWRRWHRRISINQRRFATAVAIAATGVAPLVMARGHRVQGIPEVPLVIDRKSLANVSKTKQAVEVLKKVGAYTDVERVIASRTLRAGKGKSRNRRYVQRKGPIVIYKNKGTLTKAFRNIPGVDLCCVDRLNLLKLAPGGHLGRFVVWTSDAFASLDKVFDAKKGFNLPHAKLSNASITRILQSEEIRSVIRKAKKTPHSIRKKNPLVNFGAMLKLNPYAAVLRKRQILKQRKALAIKAKLAKIAKAKKAGVELPKKKAKKEETKKDEKAKKVFLSARVKKNQSKKSINKRLVKARKAFAQVLFA